MKFMLVMDTDPIRMMKDLCMLHSEGWSFRGLIYRQMVDNELVYVQELTRI